MHVCACVFVCGHACIHVCAWRLLSNTVLLLRVALKDSSISNRNIFRVSHHISPVEVQNFLAPKFLAWLLFRREVFYAVAYMRYF